MSLWSVNDPKPGLENAAHVFQSACSYLALNACFVPTDAIHQCHDDNIYAFAPGVHSPEAYEISPFVLFVLECVSSEAQVTL